jgi:hypothetical protein
VKVTNDSSYVDKINWAIEEGIDKRVARRLRQLRGYSRGLDDTYDSCDFDKWFRENLNQ